jgi:hypothetical protein
MSDVAHHHHYTKQQKSSDEDLKQAAKDADTAVDYKQFTPKLRPEHRLLARFGKILVVLIVIAGCGYGAYMIGTHAGSNAKDPPAKAKTVVTHTAATATKQYTSNYQDLSFTYPEDWKVSETSDVITATSPSMKLDGAGKGTVNGQMILKIRDKNEQLTEFSAGNATAVLKSQIISYSAPAAGQRASTYISLLNYANSKQTGIDGIYITGDAGYESGQDAPVSDLAPIDPVVSITFAQCANNACSGNSTALTIASSAWRNKTFSAPLIKMLASLSIS